MREKNREVEKKKDTPRLKKDVAEVLVARHNYEPYIITFRHTGDNVAAGSLGTLFGFFEIEVHDEDAAYVVNFLASVAKKEYFANIRRGPIESFESTLHRVNVALAELVKHGNISWLGHLNGALAILIKNTLHFSVTGEGAFYLIRDGSLRSISEGLGDESEEPHPLKTFVEIASGELFLGDRILMLSPSLWTLFTPQDIERQAARFKGEAFEQFLKTALVNELDSVALILIRCSEETPSPTPARAAAPKSTGRLKNVFGGDAFHPKKAATHSQSPNIQTPQTEAAFVDRKTGHIYVQGEDPGRENSTRWTVITAKLSEQSAPIWHRTVYSFNRNTKKLRKWIGKEGEILIMLEKRGRRALGRRIRVLWRHTKESFPPTKKTDFLPRENDSWVEKTPTIVPENPTPSVKTFLLPKTPSRDILILWVRRMALAVKNFLSRTTTFLLNINRRIVIVWQSLDRQKQYIFIGILLVGGTFVLWRLFSPSSVEQSTPDSVATLTVAPPVWPPSNEPNAAMLSSSEKFASIPAGEKVVGLFFIENTPFLVTERSILNVSNQQSLPTPESITMATAMNDLRAIFLLASSGKLFLYTPANNKITENNLPLPSGASITSLASYLTYLYVLDAPAGKLYRFPRADGGFGAPIEWLRENTVFSPNSHIVVNENLIAWDQNKLTPFFRGQKAALTFTLPQTEFTLETLHIDGDSNTLYALDTKEKRILEWDSEGHLQHQYFGEDLSEGLSLTVSPDKTTFIVATPTNVLRYAKP